MTKTLDLRSGMPYTLKPSKPVIRELARQRMITAEIKGDPSRESADVLQVLYATAYAIRKEYKERGSVFAVEKLRGRWGDENRKRPRTKWVGKYGIPIPDDTRKVPEISPSKRVPDVSCAIEWWDYGQTAAIVHVGSYKEEAATIEELKRFVADEGCRVLPNSHEEVYLSDPRKTPESKLKTLIVCRVAGS